MVKKFELMAERPQDVPEFRAFAEDVMNFIFSTSQDNLVTPMPWGDDDRSSRMRPTVISDQGLLLQSGVPPYWQGNKISLRYDAPHAVPVEYGSPPHEVDQDVIEKWVQRKLGIKPGEAATIASRICAKIRKHGIDPHPYIRPAINLGVIRYGLSIKKG